MVAGGPAGIAAPLAGEIQLGPSLPRHRRTATKARQPTIITTAAVAATSDSGNSTQPPFTKRVPTRTSWLVRWVSWRHCRLQPSGQKKDISVNDSRWIWGNLGLRQLPPPDCLLLCPTVSILYRLFGRACIRVCLSAVLRAPRVGPGPSCA